MKPVKRKISEPKETKNKIRSRFVIEFSISKARKAQTCLAQKVIVEDVLPKNIRLIAGVDAAYFKDFAIGALAVLDYDTLDVVETQVVSQKVLFPYVSTLLSFRELPTLVSCVRKLNVQPDIFLVDGHGQAHPYRCGLATHLGVVLGKPTIGVAKNRLVGENKQVGSDTFLIHNGEIVGATVTFGEKRKPVYVSIGHMVTLETAVKIVKHCTLQGQSPEPIRQAHRIASEERKIKITANSLLDKN